ncbi:hypothetical protein CTAYLR_001146 [Chrysophaeum taylorii]|uniref:Tyrosine-protein kinase ephrin type A/B receptor-like domain-containing protein n=1 Tax=Chrysophaeum taylorii TaxID=2483200 RepID=A0AAD7UQT1_9STRA|nr:hypothetical protein CTAYLR_001146 [Chrysophaeum taylorii]
MRRRRRRPCSSSLKRKREFAIATCILVGVTVLLLRIEPHNRRKLLIAGYQEHVSWFTGENLETNLGTVPSITCPVGKYRPTSSSDTNYHRDVGFRIEGCEDCPRGRYGESEGLASQSCTAECPLGTYRDRTGAKSSDDCLSCPPGKYGNRKGLTTRDCSGDCPAGKYSSVWALTTPTECQSCPEGYRGWQCTWEVVAQHFSGDRAHHYDLDVRPASKLQSSPLQYARGSNHPKPVDLTIPYTLPLLNVRDNNA